jgi:hypothetical protein
MKERDRLAGPLFLTTFGLLLLEIFATRVLAIAVGPYAVYYTIATAMLGMGTSSAAISLLKTPTDPARRRVWLAFTMLAAAIGTLAFFWVAHMMREHGNVVLRQLPKMSTYEFFDRIRTVDTVSAIVVGGALAVPYAAYGATLAVLFRGSDVRDMTKLYAIDLLGAFAGSVGAIVALEWARYTGPLVVTILLPAVAAVGFAGWSRRARPALATVAVLSGLLAVPNVREQLEPQPDASILGHTHSRYFGYRAEVIDYMWTSQGRSSVVKLTHPSGDVRLVLSYDLGLGHARLWREDAAIPEHPSQLDLPEAAQSEVSRVVDLPRMMIAVSSGSAALILGAGAGAEMIAADRLSNHQLNIVGVELVRDGSEWARTHLDLGRFYDRSNIDLEIAEAREFIARDTRKYDWILMPSLTRGPAQFMGTASDTAGYTVTVEALDSILDHLTTKGIFALELYNKVRVAETLRGPLLRRGAEPAKSILLFGDELPAAWWDLDDGVGMLVKPSGFSREDVARVAASLPEGEAILYDPYRLAPTAHPIAAALSDASAFDRLEAEAEEHGASISPVVDDRPFPDDVITPNEYLSSRFWAGPSAGTMTGEIEAVWRSRRQSVVILLVLIAASVVLIMGPVVVVRCVRGSSQPVPARMNHLVYFGLLGAGFMLIEVGFIQKLKLLIGHPGHTIAIVLASIIVSAGVGSWLSAKTFSRGILNFRRTAGLVMLLSVTSLVVFELSVGAVLGLPRAVKYAVAFLLPVPPAIAMGHLFPQGLTVLARRNYDGLVPLCLAINALAGTITAGLGPLLAQALGFRTVILLGVACYGLVAVMPHRARSQAAPPNHD